MSDCGGARNEYDSEKGSEKLVIVGVRGFGFDGGRESQSLVYSSGSTIASGGRFLQETELLRLCNGDVHFTRAWRTGGLGTWAPIGGLGMARS